MGRLYGKPGHDRGVAGFSQPGAIAFVFTDWRAAPHMIEAAKDPFHEVKQLIV